MTTISLSAGTLSALCPNAPPEQHLCREIAYCGKAMNEAIGRAVREEGFRGVFPWAANYDSVEHNNSLAHWLRKGLRGKTDDTPSSQAGSTSRRRLEPAEGKALHMAGTSADLTPGPVHSLPQRSEHSQQRVFADRPEPRRVRELLSLLGLSGHATAWVHDLPQLR